MFASRGSSLRRLNFRASNPPRPVASTNARTRIRVVAASARDATSTVAASGANSHRSEEHTSELQSQSNLVCRLLLEKKKDYLDYPPLYSKIYSITPSPHLEFLVLHATDYSRLQPVH